MNPRHQHSGEPKILLIDDDALIRTLVSSGLTRAGMAVLQAEHGAEGLATLAAQSPDLVLLDVHMPDMDGFEVLKAMHQRHQERPPPVIMLTGDDDPASIETAFEHGATDFITKPINLRLLEQRIRYAMASHAREHHLRQLQAERTSACQIARLGFWRLSGPDAALTWSESAAELLARSHDLPPSLPDLLAETHPDDRLRLQVAFDAAARSSQAFDLEVRMPTAEHERVVRFCSPGLSQEQTLIGSFQDVTSLRRLEAQVAYLSEHDELTGLPRQRLFAKLVDEAINEAGPGRILILLISIDHVLKLSEYFGSRSSREAILTIAQRLQSGSRPAVVAGRLEDGVFGLAAKIGDAEVNALAGEIQDHLSQPITIGGRDVPARLMVGAAVYPTDADAADELIKAARLACRSAEETRRDGLHFYTAGSEHDYGSRLVLEADLRSACRDKQFFLVYQPQLDMHSGQVIGSEALLRWQHPDRGIVSPVEFIPVLEETGLIREAGAWVLEQAVADAARLRAKAYDLRMGINLSAVQLRSEQLPRFLRELCRRHDLPHHRLELEITEGTAMHDPVATRILLERLKSLGFSLSIDDFGTGHSALSYITAFPMDTIKIDRSFIQHITEGRKQRAIVTAISALSSQLGLTTIAEGIETERQRDYVDALGVHEIQGFLLSRPLPFDEFEQFLARHGTASARPSSVRAGKP
ncbi:putative bifunctional diguanylate cyclase/phosphodiesterase [Wenzhouxiangella limi]|uniref:EAL domain-containing protein n=1 Tax=Wenzhouxiangella limi TaxID=2707351 RepID=A0A845V3V1_9GAMM|nr:EAL domain-containing protein [Wenzhouxiangella limi]NDY95886.1 EAL domain-containing protein [Wenzhouxiangella limi]